MSMEPITILSGTAAPLMRANVDTDAIIPSREMTQVGKSGLGTRLFANWRYTEDRTERDDFILNRAPYRNAGILLAGENFGCGSSREGAVWALVDFGIRAIIARLSAVFFAPTVFVTACYRLCYRQTLWQVWRARWKRVQALLQL